jgi:hypothetical protein
VVIKLDNIWYQLQYQNSEGLLDSTPQEMIDYQQAAQKVLKLLEFGADSLHEVRTTRH